MKILKKYKFALLALLGSAAMVSCGQDAIKLTDNVDETAYESSNRTEVFVLDASTNKTEKTVALYHSVTSFDLYMKVNRVPKEGIVVKYKVDPSYLAEYNQEHGTSYEMYPETDVTFSFGGDLIIAPDEKTSGKIQVNVARNLAVEAGKTYAVPITVEIKDSNVEFASGAEHFMLMVNMPLAVNTTDKGEGAVKNVLFFEVNDVNPLNALEFVLSDGSLFFDEIVLFAANINYNAETGQVYLSRNPNVQFLFDNSDEYIQPLRERGMKVYLSLLGNHDESGLAQLSWKGIEMFAKEVVAYCQAYGIDGVCYDDEYSKDPDLSNPLFTEWSRQASSNLVYEIKRLDPSLSNMLYYYGAYSSSQPSVNGIPAGEFVDVMVADYGGTASPVEGQTIDNCSGMSIELARGSGNSSESTARQKTADGYGYYMFFALNPSNYSYQVPRIESVAKGLYNPVEGEYTRTLVYPTHYYPKNSTVRTAL